VLLQVTTGDLGQYVANLINFISKNGEIFSLKTQPFLYFIHFLIFFTKLRKSPKKREGALCVCSAHTKRTMCFSHQFPSPQQPINTVVDQRIFGCLKKKSGKCRRKGFLNYPKSLGSLGKPRNVSHAAQIGHSGKKMRKFS